MSTKPARTVATPGEVTSKPATEAAARDERESVKAPDPVSQMPDFSKMSEEEKAAAMADMYAKMHNLAQIAHDQHRMLQARTPQASMPEAVKHPSVKEVMASNPDKPVMTEDGIYVPPVTTANPEQTFRRV